MSLDTNNEVYKKLLECKWFENCGTEVNVDYLFPVNLTDSIDVVIDGINKTSWLNICLEKREESRSKIRKSSIQDFEKWNVYVNDIKTNYLPALKIAYEKACKDKNLPQEIVTQVNYDILIILAFEFYDPQFKCEIYTQLLEIYLSGHYPCNWKGTKKNGKIVVY